MPERKNQFEDPLVVQTEEIGLAFKVICETHHIQHATFNDETSQAITGPDEVNANPVLQKHIDPKLTSKKADEADQSSANSRDVSLHAYNGQNTPFSNTQVQNFIHAINEVGAMLKTHSNLTISDINVDTKPTNPDGLLGYVQWFYYAATLTRS